MDTGLGPGNVFGGDTHLKVMLGMSWGAPGHGSAPPGKRWGLGGDTPRPAGGTDHGQPGCKAGAAVGGSTKQPLPWGAEVLLAGTASDRFGGGSALVPQHPKPPGCLGGAPPLHLHSPRLVEGQESKRNPNPAVSVGVMQKLCRPGTCLCLRKAQGSRKNNPQLALGAALAKREVSSELSLQS